ncbi:MAG: potassium channel family protein, partial [Ignavibacteriales bacterium]|nr:potassium channel family protein [Ignavibacteriales bacterium]
MNPFKEAFRILALLTTILLIGVFGYHIIEGWSLFDALYMTVITLATVGYGETHPLSMSGRVFTLFLIMGGMGIILYGVTEITAFLVEGEMTGVLRRRKMNRAINKLNSHYILCGWGNTGHYVLEELIRTRRQCVIVEKDPERVKKLAEMKMLVIQGDATEDSVLKSAGIEQAAGLVA